MIQENIEFVEASVELIVEAIQDVKGFNIKTLNLRKLDKAICSYFIVAEGNSNTQVKAISESIEKKLREELNDRPWHVEGTDNSEWILMDYVDVVVHLFQPETRKFYDIDGLWSDAEVVEIPNL
jgi:ribosome-associated protein